MLPPPHPPGDACRTEGWECSLSPALPPPCEAPSVLTGRDACPPLFLGKVQCQGTDDIRKVDFITSSENTADFEVLRKVYDGFLTPLPTQTLSRVLYMN